MQKILLFMLCLCLHSMARGQTCTYRYWFDDKADEDVTGTSTEQIWQIEADVSWLDDNLHVFHLQVQDENGEWSSVVNRFFIKMPQESKLSARYWFDDNESYTTLPDYNSTLNIDVSDLYEGMHILHYQVSGIGNESPTTSKLFMKTPRTIEGQKTVCQMYVDGTLVCNEQIFDESGTIAWTQDVSTLSEGLHSYMLQIVTSNGTVSTIRTGYFIRVLAGAEKDDMQLLYTIDQGEAVTHTGNHAEGVYYFTLDVSDKPKGLHAITCWLTSGQGTTHLKTTYFINGRVTVDDITKLIAVYLGDTDVDFYVTDIDEDGKLTVSDITELIGIYLGK